LASPVGQVNSSSRSSQAEFGLLQFSQSSQGQTVAHQPEIIPSRSTEEEDVSESCDTSFVFPSPEKAEEQTSKEQSNGNAIGSVLTPISDTNSRANRKRKTYTYTGRSSNRKKFTQPQTDEAAEERSRRS
jgi:hypothetical protein